MNLLLHFHLQDKELSPPFYRHDSTLERLPDLHMLIHMQEEADQVIAQLETVLCLERNSRNTNQGSQNRFPWYTKLP